MELENTVEGLIRVDDLRDDYYDFDREKYDLTGRRTNNVYKLGDEILIIVGYVDIDRLEINFLPAWHL